MFRDILTSRLIFAGLVFFLIIVSGSLFYSWYMRRTTEAEFAQTDTFPQHSENKRDADVSQDFEPIDPDTLESSETSIAFGDTQAMSEAKNALPLHNTDDVETANALLPKDVVNTEAESTNVPVSPFGFGPYPEVPADYFGVPIWNQDPDKISDFPNEATKNIELIDRVLVKLWQQGDREIVGGSTHNGKVYPHYENVVYVHWEESILPNGDRYSYVTSTLTGADEDPTPEDITIGNIPSNFKVIDYNDAGFDPYQFLNLEDDGY